MVTRCFWNKRCVDLKHGSLKQLVETTKLFIRGGGGKRGVIETSFLQSEILLSIRQILIQMHFHLLSSPFKN